jgi:WD40 repeat protein
MRLPKSKQIMHKSMINDVDWAPIAGRSFHLIVSCSKDQVVIIWRVVMMDIFSGELMDPPQVQPIQVIDSLSSNITEIQRVRWNILGTSFATSSDIGDVKLWQRSQPQQPSSLTALSAKVIANGDISFSPINEEDQNQRSNLHPMQHFKQIIQFKAK